LEGVDSRLMIVGRRNRPMMTIAWKDNLPNLTSTDIHSPAADEAQLVFLALAAYLHNR
jgi:hypothetical protein